MIQSFTEQINYVERLFLVTPNPMLASGTQWKIEWLPLMYIIADRSSENPSLHYI